MPARFQPAALALCLIVGGCVAAPPQLPAFPLPVALPSAPLAGRHQAEVQCGLASWYAMGGRTASGEPADPSTMTGAHRSLPFGTRVEVTNLDNGQRAVVRINDRGPFVAGRIIDVSRAAAERLGFTADGTARVRIRATGGPHARLPVTSCS